MWNQHPKQKTRFHWLFSSLLLSACASNIPLSIQQTPTNNPTLEQVRSADATPVNTKVRWGGQLLETDNQEHNTQLTILATRLSKGGRPSSSENSPGRFIAIVPQFLEPSVYSKDRKITIYGTLLRTETRKVGEYDYPYPIVQVEELHLWPVERDHTDEFSYPWMHHHPWYYDPWYFPRHPLAD